MSEMSRLTIIQNNIVNLVSELTELWLEWMKCHNSSNNPKNSIGIRRKSGERSEQLQRRRQEILVELNEAFDSIIKR